MAKKPLSHSLSQSYSRVGQSHHRVYIGLNTHYGYGREIFQGIIAYAQKVGTWSFQYEFEPDRVDNLLDVVHADGIILEGKNDRHRDQLHQLHLPTVTLVVGLGWNQPRAIPDNPKVGRMALEYYRDLGFTQVGWVSGGRWLDHPVFEHFQRAADEYRIPCHALPDIGRADLAAWLQQLPTPIGLLTHGHEQGVAVIETCNQVGLHVPEEIAVLSIGRDDILCNLSRPPLSSFDHGLFRIGYEAGALLDAQMNGQPHPNYVTVQPVGINERQSTDTLAIADPDIVAALRFLRENAFDPIQVEDILTVVPISRRALEMGFRKYLHRTVYEEIVRVRLERAKSLLIRSDLPMPDIAARSGFGSASQLSVVFRREISQTPGEFRAMHRMR